MREIAGRIPENSKEVVSTILRQVTGHQAASVEPITGIGMNNSVSVAATSHGRFVVRTNVESHLFRYQREEWCLNQLKATPVLTPQVLACGILAGHSYSVAPFIEGSRPIGEGMDQIRVWKTLGKYASYLNQIEAPKPGSAEAAYFPTTWKQQVASDMDLIFKDDLWLKSGLLFPAQQDLLRSYLLASATVEAPQGVCVFDLTIGNAVICDSDYEKVYLLDLEAANIAPVPHYQLACIAADRGPDSDAAIAFREGYRIHENKLAWSDSEFNRFTLYRVMRASAWARDRYPSLLEENLRRTKPIIEHALRQNLC